jgi:prepilin-type N-terminal cleavage/methylation domain-containing protein
MAGLSSPPFMEARRREPGDSGVGFIQAPRRKPGDLPPVNPSLRDGRCIAGSPPRGFTLTELLVVIGIVLVLMGLLSAAVAGARGSVKKQATSSFIQKIDAVIQEQYLRYDSIPVATAAIPTAVSAATNRSAARAWYIRRNLISGDLPDCWEDVRLMATGTAAAGEGETFPVTGIQRSCVGYFLSVCDNPSSPLAATKPTDEFEDAECLFMIITAGGVADCIDCGELRSAMRGDKDADGAPEFWDEWGNPIRFVLWPPALELPRGTRFFSGSRSLDLLDSASPRPGLGMRPLIFSAGPDGLGGTAMNGGSNFSLGIDCGNPANATVALFGGPDSSGGSARADNITNFDDEAKQ